MTATRSRQPLPQLAGEMCLTDSGLETTLIFHEGFDLPAFASFPLLDTVEGRAALDHYFRTHVDIARRHDASIVLETPTWRANSVWGDELGYSPAQLDDLNRRAVDLVRGVAEGTATDSTHVVVSGNIGPLADGYVPGEQRSPQEAESAHRPQIQSFAEAGADMICALTLTYPNEAIGIARAAAAADLPAAICFTVETDGNLPNGQTLRDAIAKVDAATGSSVAYFGVNCAHPTHFQHVFSREGAWKNRIGACRANASRMSHAELDDAEELDSGDPVELGAEFADLAGLLPELRVVGGCCGTDHHHIASIGEALFG